MNKKSTTFLVIIAAIGAWGLYHAGELLRYLPAGLMLIMPLIVYLHISSYRQKGGPGFNNNLPVYTQPLQDDVPNDALYIAGKDLLHYAFFYYINKKGWIFRYNSYPAARLKDATRKGAWYLCFEAGHIDGNQSITPYLDKKMLVKRDHLKSAAALF